MRTVVKALFIDPVFNWNITNSCIVMKLVFCITSNYHYAHSPTHPCHDPLCIHVSDGWPSLYVNVAQKCIFGIFLKQLHTQQEKYHIRDCLSKSDCQHVKLVQTQPVTS